MNLWKALSKGYVACVVNRVIRTAVKLNKKQGEHVTHQNIDSNPRNWKQKYFSLMHFL